MYQAGSITNMPVTVTVQVPTTTGVSIVADSFNVAPTQITTGATFRDADLEFLLAGRRSQRRNHLADEHFQSAKRASPCRSPWARPCNMRPWGAASSDTLPPLVVAGVPATQTLSIPVQVAAPGVPALAAAAVAANQIGNTNLANQFNDLSIALTNLVQTPTSAVYAEPSAGCDHQHRQPVGPTIRFWRRTCRT